MLSVLNQNKSNINQQYTQQVYSKAIVTKIRPDQANCSFLYEKNGLKIYKLNSANFTETETKRAKRILIIGETGQGKTSWINALANYVMGVESTDNFRYILIDESGLNKKKSESTTEDVNEYQIMNNNKIDQLYIQIIDTPGFYDVQGLKRDQTIMNSICDALKRYQSLNSVCFTQNGTLSRYTIDLQYVYNQTTKLFAKDIKPIITTLFTFITDFQNEPVSLQFLKNNAGFQTPNYFCFNNGFLYIQKQDNPLYQNYWKNTQINFEKFVTLIHLASMDPVNLKDTIENIQTREKLENVYADLELQTEQYLSQVQTQTNKIEQMKLNTQKFQKQENFVLTYVQNKTEQISIPSGQKTTTCMVCQVTCHQNCALDDGQKKGCVAMDPNGYCKFCVNKCFWNQHLNKPYIIKITSMNVDEIMQKFNGNGQDFINNQQKYLYLLKQQLLEKIKSLQECIKKIKKLALSNDFDKGLNIFNLMIMNQEQKKDEGYQDRIKTLEQFQKKYVILQKIKNTDEPAEILKFMIQDQIQENQN